jgi:hypothetical protein
MVVTVKTAVPLGFLTSTAVQAAMSRTAGVAYTTATEAREGIPTIRPVFPMSSEPSSYTS